MGRCLIGSDIACPNLKKKIDFLLNNVLVDFFSNKFWVYFLINL
jgi:hypothetical protein